MNITPSPEIYIMAFGFLFLFACIFLKNIMIYIALILTWLAVIFWPNNHFPYYVQYAAVAVCVFGAISILHTRGD